MNETRINLTGTALAVSETLDELLHRCYGITSGGSYHREFLEWLADRGYAVAPPQPCPLCEQPLDLMKATPPSESGPAWACHDCVLAWSLADGIPDRESWVDEPPELER